MKTRRTLAASAALCAVLAGCGQNETTNTGSTAPTSPAVATTAAPTTSPTEEPTATEGSAQSSAPAASETGAATPRGTATSKDAARGAVTVPQTDPGDYGDAAVKAWAAGDKATLAKYVSGSAVADLGSGVPEGELLRTACDGDMCSYTTDAGKRVTLTFDLDAVKAGKGGGIVGAKVD